MYVRPLALVWASRLRRGATHTTLPTEDMNSPSWSSLSSGWRLPTYTVRLTSSFHFILDLTTACAYAGSSLSGIAMSGWRGMSSRFAGMPATDVFFACSSLRTGSELTPRLRPWPCTCFSSSRRGSSFIGTPPIRRVAASTMVSPSRGLSFGCLPALMPVPSSSELSKPWSLIILIASSLRPLVRCSKASRMGFHFRSFSETRMRSSYACWLGRTVALDISLIVSMAVVGSSSCTNNDIIFP
mmetsp:Transcript_27164/g.48018  ORF Transcript_27164/g.48018 Transcript_27164/m.48018 type:complete len:242 (-) Transcript_27164:873-1598(-)